MGQETTVLRRSVVVVAVTTAAGAAALFLTGYPAGGAVVASVGVILVAVLVVAPWLGRRFGMVPNPTPEAIRRNARVMMPFAALILLTGVTLAVLRVERVWASFLMIGSAMLLGNLWVLRSVTLEEERHEEGTRDRSDPEAQ